MRRALALLLFALVIVGGALTVPTARSASPDVVVSQVFAGGGNAGAPTRTTSSSSSTAARRRSTSAAGRSSTRPRRRRAGRRRPRRLDRPGPPLPRAARLDGSGRRPTAAPDATGTTTSPHGRQGRARADATALTCGASAGSCAGAAIRSRLVGYGAATDYEGAGPAPALGNTTAAVRAADGCTDTNANAADFTAAPPAPRNTALRDRCSARDAGGHRLGGRGGRRRRPAGALDRARADERQLRQRLPAHPAPVSERVTVVSNNAPATRSPCTLGVRPADCRSGSREPPRVGARSEAHLRVARWQRFRSPRRPTCSSARRPRPAPAPATCGTRDSASPRRSRLCRRVTTRPPSRLR